MGRDEWFTDTMGYPISQESFGYLAMREILLFQFFPLFMCDMPTLMLADSSSGKGL